MVSVERGRALAGRRRKTGPGREEMVRQTKLHIFRRLDHPNIISLIQAMTSRP